MAVNLPESARIVVDDPSQVANARRIARKMAIGAGFDETNAETVGLVVTEAATNLMKYAGGGEIIVRSADMPENEPAIEVLALDRGPGMSNLDRCLQDGFSTGGSPGQGLGAIVRLSAAADFYSVPTEGTAVLARFFGRPPGVPARHRHPPFFVGAVNVCKPGQEVCGDSWGIEQHDGKSVVLVADGLGHGLDAKTASTEAVRMLRANWKLNPKALLEVCHQALRSTRGAAIAVASIDAAEGVLLFAGLGNISAQIWSARSGSQHLVSANGTAGHRIFKIQEFRYGWPPDALLILHSDGLSSHTSLEKYPRLVLRDPSLTAGVLYRDFSRRNDDSTIVVLKAA